MAINFPDSPANNDSFTSNNKTWVFDGTVWNITSGTNSVADGAITTAKIDTGAVTAAKIASDAVTTAKILDANITAAKIAADAVTTAKILDANITEAKIASNAVSTGKLGTDVQLGYRNVIINGKFDVWQRGTSFSNPASGGFTADRWSLVYDGTGATRTISQQTFTPGTGPVTGLEGRFFYRYAQSVAGSGGSYNLFQNRIEDVRTFAGQTVTISFYAKAAASTSLVKLNLEQNFGSGGSPSADVSTDIASTNFTLTSSWQRFTVTTSVPSISGKTIGTTTSGYLGLRVWIPINTTFTIDVWGVQLEAGSVATPFEFEDIGTTLAKCQRYCLVIGKENNLYAPTGFVGNMRGTTTALIQRSLPQNMRGAPTVTIDSAANFNIDDGTTLGFTPSAFALDRYSANALMMYATVTGGTTGRAVIVYGNNVGNGIITVSSEL